MPTLPKRKTPAKQKELPLTSRLDKMIQNRVEQGMAYEYDSQDKRELVFNDLKKRYPDTVKLSYQWVIRVKQQSTGKEFLIYHCNETLTDRDNNDHHYDSLLGVWPAIESSGKINPETGERENASIKRSYNVFDIPFSAEKAKEILYDKRLVLQPSQLLIGLANEAPGEVVNGRKWVVFNADEFIDAEFDVLLFAAEHGYLERDPGGAKRAKAALEGTGTASTGTPPSTGSTEEQQAPTERKSEQQHEQQQHQQQQHPIPSKKK